MHVGFALLPVNIATKILLKLQLDFKRLCKSVIINSYGQVLHKTVVAFQIPSGFISSGKMEIFTILRYEGFLDLPRPLMVENLQFKFISLSQL